MAQGLLIAVASLVAEHGLWGVQASGTVSPGLRCPGHVASSWTED